MTHREADRSSRVAFVLSLGKALHNYGYPAHHLEEALAQTAARLDLRAHFFSTPTSIFAAFGEDAEQRTHLIRVEPGEVDLGKLAELDGVAARVVDGSLEPGAGRDEVARIVEIRRYGRGLTLLAFAVASGGAARLLGGGGLEIAMGLGIGTLVGLLSQALERTAQGARLFEPLAALVAAFTATVAAGLWFPDLAIRLATLAGLIVLIPGLTLTVAMAELSTRHLVSGTARLAGAALLFLTIAFGAALGNHLGSVLVGPVTPGEPAAASAWTFLAALVLSPLSFVVLFRAQMKDALWIVLAGALGLWGANLGAAGLGVELGIFLGSLAVGVAGNLYGRVMQRPPQILVVPGILMLVPGSIGFRSLGWLMDREVVLGVEQAFTTVLMAVGLAAGLLLANALLPPRGAISTR